MFILSQDALIYGIIIPIISGMIWTYVFEIDDILPLFHVFITLSPQGDYKSHINPIAFIFWKSINWK